MKSCAVPYSYDVHGNVKTILQVVGSGAGDPDTPVGEVEGDGRRLKKRLDYEYDLISGNVNKVIYQKDQTDQFIHRYEYDGDNRITEVYTSHDGIIWDKDAEYDYYGHGPLARKTIGGKSVEVQDYAYTIQGWMKGLEGENFDYALGYNDNDYQSIGQDNLMETPIEQERGLHNGNIATMSTNTPAFDDPELVQQFVYDQLNRIKESSVHGRGDAWKTTYAYDQNGNIEHLTRNDHTGMPMDDLHYNYQTKEDYRNNTNKLRWVDDNVDSSNVNDDIKDQKTDNYAYDDIGQLIGDVDEDIDTIEWNVSGKVKAVIRKSGSEAPDLLFSYNGNGERVTKTVVHPVDKTTTTTYYVRDAEGNVMTTYKKAAGSPLTTDEYHIYGSERLGLEKASEATNYVTTTDSTLSYSRGIGLKQYELKDHLGNVRVVIGDQPKSDGDAKVLVASSFYPYGSTMNGRRISSDGYRYGFNGKEFDQEWNSGGAMYDYGFRIYDPRLGKFLSTDPLKKDYPYFTPYQFASNTPIAAIDRDGLEAEIVINSPWFKNEIEEAIDEGDVDRAQRLARLSTQANRPDGDYAEEVYKGSDKAGTFNWNESNPNVLTVFDSDGKELMRITQDPPKIIEENKGFWQRIGDFFSGDFSGTNKVTQKGGYNFYAEGAETSGTTAEAENPVESIDITYFYNYLTATKFGPGGPSKKNIAEVVDKTVSLFKEAKDVVNNNETETKPDSSYCDYCEEYYHNDQINYDNPRHSFDYKENE